MPQPRRETTHAPDDGDSSLLPLPPSVPTNSAIPIAPLEASLRALRIERAKTWTKRYRTEVASSSSSLLSVALTYPLDTIKTNLQTHKSKGTWDCVHRIYQKGGCNAKKPGLRGFWSGVSAPLFSVTFVRTVSFTIYQKSKYLYDDYIRKFSGQSPLAIANTHGACPTWHTFACFGAAGVTAGSITTPIACPLELIKTSQQIAEANYSEARVGLKPGAAINPVVKSYHKKGMLRTAHMLIKNRGLVRGLYSGFAYHFARDSIGTGIYFMTYECCKQMLANARGNNPTTLNAVVVAGGLCGLVSWAAIYPIDAAKSKYQKECLTSHRDSTKSIRVNYFDKPNYKGLGISMARSATTNAIFFVTFESMKKYINGLDIDTELLLRADAER